MLKELHEALKYLEMSPHAEIEQAVYCTLWPTERYGQIQICERLDMRPSEVDSALLGLIQSGHVETVDPPEHIFEMFAIKRNEKE